MTATTSASRLINTSNFKNLLILVGSFMNSGQVVVIAGERNGQVADLDGDGDLDIFIDSSIWLNDGARFSKEQEFTLLGNGAALDGDGDIDIFIVNNGPNIVWWSED